jgi:hypothetical protein
MGEAASKIAESTVNPENFSEVPSKMLLAFTLSSKAP